MTTLLSWCCPEDFSPPQLTCRLAGDLNEHNIWGLVQGGSLKLAASFIFLLFMCWFKMMGKDLVEIVPSHLPSHSSVLIMIEMSLPLIF